MFDWFWEFLYGISKSIFRLIDGLMDCAKMLCGIDPILVDDKETDFITFLLTSDNVALAFKTATIVGCVLVGLFAVAAIIKSIISEKANSTSGQIFVKTFKTVFMYLFIPFCMIVVIYFLNTVMSTLYAATLSGEKIKLGNFLCGAFAQDAASPKDFYLSPGFDYTSTSQVKQYVNLSDFDFFFSWIAGVCILISLAQALLMFVDRAISIIVLFIVSPISLSTNVVDDGAHFKLWRDQIMVKFLTGYGCIIGLNVYILVISAITSDSVVFFPNSWFLNNLMKIAFILGGAVSMQRIMALVGNLVSAGAGSNELRDNAIANASFGRALTAPFRGIRAAANFRKDAKQYGLGTAIAGAMGFKTDKDYGARSKAQKQAYQEKLEQKANFMKEHGNDFKNENSSKVENAISGDNTKVEEKTKERNNQNNQKPGIGISLTANAINKSLSGNSKDNNNVNSKQMH